MSTNTIAVAMSGGVDSSVVAALLRAGGTAIGLTMQLWNQRRLAGHEGCRDRNGAMLFAR
jgi:tRNA-specific 2-thiouridylase